MSYFEVLPRDPGYRPDRPLAYSYASEVVVGRIVLVPLKNKRVMAIVVKKISKPAFRVKKIIEVYDFLPPIPENSLKLMKWLHIYYPGPMGSAVQQFVPKNIVQLPDLERQKIKEVGGGTLPAMTPEQRKVLKSISVSGSYLLHGSTGSGKTRVYIELAQRSLKNNKSVLVLTPEISLTSQLASDFKKNFGDRVLVVHSMLSPKEHYMGWVRIITSEQPLVVIGPRSALFSPFKRLGLVIVDEAHEDAYKQEQSPQYHAVRVASTLANIHGAVFLIGSATPSVVDYFLADNKNIPILKMQKMAIDQKQADVNVSVIDLTDHSQTGRHPYLSNMLLKEIEDTLTAKEQVLLFLNRRGTARVVFCENCGWKSVCPRCDLPLIYHGDDHIMQCHTCGFTESVVTTCPVCHQDKIVFKGIGTKAITEVIKKLYPQANVARFDADNKKAERFEQRYESIKAGQIDILIGTQTITKGLDLPKLGLVGIIVAESSLYFPDFSAGERTYQLLTQAIGRVGRGHRRGRVVIQTFEPVNPVIQAAVKRDWPAFYKNELEERKKFTFPPFCYLLKLTCKRAHRESVIDATKKFSETITTHGLKIQVLGPAPAFYEKIRGKYQWQVILKSKDRAELIKAIEYLPAGWSFNIDPVNLL